MRLFGYIVILSMQEIQQTESPLKKVFSMLQLYVWLGEYPPIINSSRYHLQLFIFLGGGHKRIPHFKGNPSHSDFRASPRILWVTTHCLANYDLTFII